MLKVLFLTSSVSPNGRENVGDRVILAGTRNLIAAAFGHYVYKEQGRWSLFDGDPEEFDLIVYAGMPQYGARSAPSKEEGYFDQLIARSRRPVFMNIGGGAIHPIGINPNVESIKMANSAIAKYYKRQSKVVYRTARDMTTKLFFDRIGVACELRCCPSYFSTATIARGTDKRGAIAALSNTTFVTNRFRGDLGTVMARLRERHPKYDLVSHSGSDLGLLSDLNLPHVYFRNEMALLSYYANVTNLFALRIHAAVPAWTFGAKVVGAGFDNRVGMFDDVGMPVPWVNMITETQDSAIDALETLLEDDRCHLPLARRTELVQAQLKRMSAEVRAAAPGLVDAASSLPVTLDGWKSHPPVGTVVPNGDAGFDLRPVPLTIAEGTEDAQTDIVRIPAGQRAAAAVAPLQFPLSILGKKFSTRGGKVTGGKISADLKSLNGALAYGHSVFLPAGEYAVRMKLVFRDGTRPGSTGAVHLIARNPEAILSEKILDVRVLAEKGKRIGSTTLKLQSRYGAEPIEFIVRVAGFTGTERMNFEGLEIKRL
jgi:hypothetical protein